MSQPISKDLEHFKRLAARGLNPGSSTYEARCYNIAVAIGETVSGLDGSALCGLAEFAEWAATDARSVALWVESLGSSASRRK